MLLGHILSDEQLSSELSLFFRQVRFNEQKFPAGKFVSDIKYYCPGFENNNSFYLFNDQLDYLLADYFAESKTLKGNINKFLFNLLITSLIKNLSYQNINKWMKKLSEILWGIWNNIWIKHKFELKKDVVEIAEQEIVIHS